VKGLSFPGREANYDCNSQVPSGRHNDRDIFYAFGRYPAEDVGPDFAVYDLVICHGDFLNADHDYVHRNLNVKGFGSYGDIMIRDRKMYVAPTPFALTNGTERQVTLIVPTDCIVDARVREVGRLIRTETDQAVAGYNFDLETNVLTPRRVENRHAGAQHSFVAYRASEDPAAPVILRAHAAAAPENDADDADD